MRDETRKLVLGWRDREVVVIDARIRELAAQQRSQATVSLAIMSTWNPSTKLSVWELHSAGSTFPTMRS